MYCRNIFSGYKTHGSKGLLEDAIVMKYLLVNYGEAWNERSFEVDGRRTFLEEGEHIEYCLYDEEFITKKIEKEYNDIFNAERLTSLEISFLYLIRTQDKQEIINDRERRRWLNQMEIDHD